MSQLSKNEFAEIPADNPWKNDVLKRKAVADYLTPVVGSIRQPFVVSLHSSYGTGKTYFLKAWKKDLENNGFHTAYFDAWETDFSNDALAAFIASLKRQLFDKSDVDIGEKVKGLMKSVGGFLRKEAVPMLARAALRKVLGDEEAKALKDTIGLTADDLEELAGAFATESLADQQVAEDSMASFKAALKEIVETLTAKEVDEDKKKVIIFVDELDRCRPIYAIEVLECIKHFFSVPGLVFVLAIDDEQLKSAIASVYGSELDGDGYLRRFIDWRFSLPEPPGIRFSEFLVEKHELKSNAVGHLGNDADFGIFEGLLRATTFSLRLSLRDQERCITEIDLAVRSRQGVLRETFWAFGVVAALRMKRPHKLSGLLAGGESIEAFLAELDLRMKDPQMDNPGFNWEYLRPIARSLFLKVTERRTLKSNLQSIEQNINDLRNEKKAGSTDFQDLTERAHYLSQVLDMQPSWAYRHEVSKSVAEEANATLNAAKQISG